MNFDFFTRKNQNTKKKANAVDPDAINVTDGKSAEQFAEAYLIQNGLKYLARNYACRGGEIDLILEKSNCLLFVEVKFRSRSDYGYAQEMVSLSKQKKIIRAAQYFLIEHPKYKNYDCRFDVIALQKTAAKIEVNWIKNAFLLE
ncbi:YraN family protein [Sessilibacter sp. MAH2]